MLAMISLLLALSQGVPEPRVATSAEPCLSGKTEIPWKMSELNAAELSFYRGVAAKAGQSVEQMLAPLASDYYSRNFSFAEFRSAVASLKHLLETKDIKLVDVMGPVAADQKSLLILLDPTCEVCRKTLSVAHKASLNCSEFPSIILEVLPSSDPNSLEASIALALIKQRKPDLFPDAFSEFQNLLPADGGRLKDLVTYYLPDFMADQSAYGKIKNMLVARREALHASGYYAPVLIFRGRPLQRDSTAEVPFDPSHSPQFLAITIDLIRLVDSQSR